MAADSLRFLDLAKDSYRYPGILDKEEGVRQYVSYMLDRTCSMFKWEGLPDTIPEYILEMYLQTFGYAAFVEVTELTATHNPRIPFKPGLHIFFGGIGGERDIYYRPRLFIAANPRLKQSINATILYDNDDYDVENPCVLMRNDTNFIGLLPLFYRYASQMVENDISIRSAQINARAQVGISTGTSRDAEAARKYLDGLEAGKLATIGEEDFLEKISVTNVGTQSANVIIQLIELQQYLKASWFNDLGLNANFNMKREYISREEIGSQTDVLLPLVDDMLECRQRAAELVNKLFGLNVSVEKSSAWSSKDQTVLNSLATGAQEGNVPLTSGVEDMLQEATGGSNVQLMGNSEGGQEGGGEGESAGEVTQPTQEADETVQKGGQAAVQVTINIGDDSDAKVSEKPEESDSE